MDMGKITESDHVGNNFNSLPEYTTTEMNNIPNPQENTYIYNTTDHKPYYRSDSAWVAMV